MKTLNDYAQACGELLAEQTGDASTPVTGIRHDSRQVQPGDLFIAIRGALADGRRFAANAVERGAVAILHGGEEALELGVPTLRVTDDYAAFGRVAECYHDYPARELTIAGITGTNGKTTTAYLLRDMLAAAGHQVGLVGTVSYSFAGREIPAERTTPMPSELQQMLREMVDAGITHVVMEASSHALHQRRLGTMQLHTAAFTNLTLDHSDYHPTMDAYFDAKYRLFGDHLAPDGGAIVNADDAYGQRLLQRLEHHPRTISCGFTHSADWAVQRCDLSREGGQVTVRHPQGTHLFQTPLTGRYNVANLLAAAASADCLGVSLASIDEAVRHFAGVPGRLQRLHGKHGISIFIDYAHTADALANVLAAIAPFKEGRLLVVFGCGGDRDRSKRPQMAQAAADFADRIIVTSDNPRTEDPECILDDIIAGLLPETPYERLSDRREAIQYAIDQARPGDTIVIAGKGHEPYQEIHGVKHPFSDLDVARQALVAAGLQP